MEWGSVAKGFAEGFKSAMDATENTLAQKTKKMQNKIADQFYAIKKMMFRSIIELILISISMVCILVGLIMFVDRFISLDYVLLIVGLLTFNFVLLLGKFKR